MQERQLSQDESPGNLILKGNSCFSNLFFTWIQPVLTFGSKTILEQKDIPQLDDKMRSVVEVETLQGHLEKQFKMEKKNLEGMSLLKAMFASTKHLTIPIMITAFIAVGISMSIPYVTQVIIAYISSGKKELSKSIMYIAGILLLKFVQNVAESKMYYNLSIIGYNLCNTISVCIFEKASRYPTLCSKKYTVAELINYSQVDAQRLTYMGYYTSSVLFIPLQLGIGIFLLYNFIGVSFLAGIGIIVIMGVMIFFVNKLNTKANNSLLKSKDARMKITNEIFNQIRFIKANAWQKYFFNKLNRARNDQLTKLKKVNFLYVLSILFLWITTPLILTSIFGVFTALGNQLTAEKAFTTIVLFNILQFPLRALPQSISQLNQIWVSLKRIENFLQEEEIDRSYIQQKQDESSNVIGIQKGTFYWEVEEKKQEQEKDKKKKKKEEKEKEKENKKKLKREQSVEKKESTDSINISENQYESEIKKSLLSDASFLEQKPVIPLHIKALKNVHLQVKRGKFTIILGNIGSGKSSLLYSVLGQMKAYPDSGAHIDINGSIAFVVQKAWMLSKSIQQNILMTQQKDNSRFQQSIKYSCLEEDLKQLPDGQKTIIGQKGINISGGQKARVSLARALYSNKDIYLLDDIISAVDVHVANKIVKQCILGYLKSKTRVLVTHAIAYARFADEIIIMRKGQIVERGSYQEIKNTTYFKQIQQLQGKEIQQTNEQTGPKVLSEVETPQKQNQNPDIILEETETNKLVQELMMPEDRQKGKISSKVYKTYMDLNGGWKFLFSVTFLMAGWISLSTLANIEIENWCENPDKANISFYLYIVFSIASAFFAFGRALVLVFSGIRQGRISHKKMIKGLMYASIPQFYDRVPIGRILNRVSKDLKQLDSNIAFTVGNVFVSTFSLIGNLVICVYASTPYILIPIALFLFICFFFKAYYMKTKRQVARLQNITSSPIVSSFNEIMNGLPTIRAYNLERKFVERQCEIVDINKRNRVCQQTLSTWFSLRLAWLSYIVNISAMAFCIVGGNDNASLAGLLFAYSFTIDDNVISLVYSLATLETQMVSIQRVANFMNIEAETGYVQYVKKWRTKDEESLKLITKGEVGFEDMSLKYRKNLPNVLDHLNMTIRAGQKIGVVGRTGAGKSTLIQAILRTIEPTEGKLFIDGMDITTIPLKSLRSNLTLIAQEPVLIAGTLRQNLDPRGQHSDQKLIQSLRKCYIYDIFKERELLQTQISQSGDNISIGQKQLICIARAILRQNKLVLIDQATANIDMKSDQLIQQTIRTQFSGSTVITIAHRIKTILHSDRILVMEKGKIKEFDTPDRLLQKKGLFYQMYTKSQEHNQL